MSNNNIYNEIINGKGNFTQIENYLIINVMPLLSKKELLLFLIILRFTEGFHRHSYITNMTNLNEYTHIGLTNIKEPLYNLQDKFHLIKINKINRYKIEIIFDRAEVKKLYL